MDTLTLELLSSLLSNIGDEAIGQLSITSKNMGNITNKLKDDTIFYKSRVENLLGYFIDSSYTGDWKGFYYILIKSDQGKANWLTSALSSAARNGDDLAIKVLLEDSRVNPSDDNNKAIQLASENGHLEVVKLLLEDKRVDPSANYNRAIQMASHKGYEKIVKLLLEDIRVDPSDDDNLAIRWASDRQNYAIQLASEGGHLEVIKLLLTDPRVNPSDEKNRAIILASMEGHPDVVKLLLADPRVNPSDRNNGAILFASEKNNPEVVKLLLGSDKINLNAKTQALKKLQSNKPLLGEPSYDMNYDNIERLAKMPLMELIQIGNQNLQDRQIIMTKYFWWLRLKIMYDMDNVIGNPFKVALQQEQ